MHEHGVNLLLSLSTYTCSKNIIGIYLTHNTLKLLHLSLMVYPLSAIMPNAYHYIHPCSSHAGMLTDRYSFITQ